jgi:hypothetical protein
VHGERRDVIADAQLAVEQSRQQRRPRATQIDRLAWRVDVLEQLGKLPVVDLDEQVPTGRQVPLGVRDLGGIPGHVGRGATHPPASEPLLVDTVEHEAEVRVLVIVKRQLHALAVRRFDDVQPAEADPSSRRPVEPARAQTHAHTAFVRERARPVTSDPLLYSPGPVKSVTMPIAVR